ncbi:Ig-like domain-containing protein [Paenibacillus tyrfis]|uniref:Dockerin domain-containing protein n=1 Tax=Paenibacillus tyrfis TaxID=1501230 RepID=A0A081P214_9BACL|nr:Ig-like domain-containing protein [Paenibacillus tyrfis]KEQ24737.1 hypothetical protein ET33_06565 [Paenibacillus tyrfis]
MMSLFKRALLLSLALVLLLAGLQNKPVQAAGPDWMDVGTLTDEGYITNVSLATYDGVLYAVYVQSKPGIIERKLKVKKLNGSTWEPVGGEWVTENKFIDEVQLVVSQGVVYVAYKTNSPRSSYSVAVKKYEGDAWKAVGDSEFVVEGVMTFEAFSFVVDEGIPYVAYTTSQITVKKFDNGSWQTIGNDRFGNHAQAPHLYVDKGTPYVAYQETNPAADIILMKLSGQTWEKVGSKIPLPSWFMWVVSPKVYVDNGTPYVAFGQQDMNNAQHLNVRKYNGSSWESVGSENFSDGTQAMHITFEGTRDQLFVSYQEFDGRNGGFNMKPVLKQYLNGSWVTVPSQGTFPTDYYDIAIALDPGALYVAANTFDQATNKGKLDIKLIPLGLQISSHTPAKDATGVPLKPSVSMTFSQSVAPVSGKTISIRKASDNSVVESMAVDDAQKVSITGNTVSLRLNTSLASNTKYYVSIDSGAFLSGDGSVYKGIADPKEWSFTTLVKGDLTGDGKVTPADILLVNQYILGKITLTPEQLKAVDMNDDGVVDAKDTAIMMNIYLGRAG